MAMFHSHVGYVSRGGEGSVCSHAAYITGEKVTEERTGVTYNYEGKEREVVYKNILLPKGMEAYNTTEKLWNHVEAFEERIAKERYGNYDDPIKQARSLAAKERFLATAATGYKLECSLPVELSLDEQIELSDRLARKLFLDRDLVVQYVIHDKPGNPHIHFLSSFRPVVNGEFSKRKVYYMSSDVKKMREDIASLTNQYAKEKGYDFEIDHRSLKDQGIDREPTRHEGWYGRKLEELSRIVLENKEIIDKNTELFLKDPYEMVKKLVANKTVFSLEELKKETLDAIGKNSAAAEVLWQRIEGETVPDIMGRVRIFGKFMEAALESWHLTLTIREDEKAQGTPQKAHLLYDDLKEARQERTRYAKEVAADYKSYEWLAAKVGLKKPVVRALAGEGRVRWSEGALPFDVRSVPQDLRSGDMLASLAKAFGEGELDDTIVELFNLEGLGKDARSQELYMGKEDKLNEEKILSLKEDLLARAQQVGIKERFMGRIPEKLLMEVLRKEEEGQKYPFSEEQRAAIEGLVGKSSYSALSGKAGTGKTRVLKVVAAAYQKAGYRVIGTSFQGAAVGELAGSLGDKMDGGYTLDKLTREWREIDAGATSDAKGQYELDSKTLVIVDEAGMVPGRLLEPLLERAHNKGSKVIMVGDSRQIAAIDRADMGRLILEGAYELSHIKRQRHPGDAGASLAAAKGDMRAAVTHYEQMGAFFKGADGDYLHTIDGAKMALAMNYVESVLDGQDLDLTERLNKTAALAFMNKDVNDLNRAIHNIFKNKGLVGEEVLVVSGYGRLTHDKTALLLAHDTIREKIKEIRSGNEEGIEAPSFTKITYQEAKALCEHKDALGEGAAHIIDEVLKPKTFSLGDKLLFTSNWNKGIESERPIYNGTLGVLENYNPYSGVITVTKDTGEEVLVNLEDYQEIELGYALSINRSQGKSFDNTHIFFNNTNGAKISYSLVYVAMTRHREKAQFYISQEYVGKKDLLYKVENQDKLMAKDMEDKEKITKVGLVHEASQEARQLWNQIQKDVRKGEYNPTDHPLYSLFGKAKERRDEGAKELLNNWKDYNVHIVASGLHRSNLERWAGITQYKKTAEEEKLDHYRALKAKAQILWKEIVSDRGAAKAKEHSHYPLFTKIRESRNEMAYRLTSFGGADTLKDKEDNTIEVPRFNLNNKSEWALLNRHTQAYIKAQQRAATHEIHNPDRREKLGHFFDRVRELIDVRGFIRKSLGDGKTAGDLLRFGNKGEIAVNPETGVWTNFKDATSGSLLGSEIKPGLLSQSASYRSHSFKESLAFAQEFIKDSNIREALDTYLQGKRLTREFEKELGTSEVGRQNAEHERRQQELIVRQEKKMALASQKARSVQVAQGTVVETYLKGRGIHEMSSDVGYREVPYKEGGEWKRCPSMTSIIRDTKGNVQGIQTTLLTPEGAKDKSQEVNKRTQGVLKGGFVKVQEDYYATERVILAEGVETALSIKQAGIKGEIRAVLGINNFKSQEGLQEKDVYIAADNDGSNKAVTRALEEALETHRATLIKPQAAGQDFNDVLQEKGVEGVRQYFMDHGFKFGESPEKMENVSITDPSKVTQEQKDAFMKEVKANLDLIEEGWESGKWEDDNWGVRDPKGTLHQTEGEYLYALSQDKEFSKFLDYSTELGQEIKEIIEQQEALHRDRGLSR